MKMVQNVSNVNISPNTSTSNQMYNSIALLT